MHPDRERLTLVALGEQPAVTELSGHLDDCARCRAEVIAMRDTIALARETELAPLETPPGHVWSGIAAELALDADPPPAVAVPPRRRRTAVVAALAATAAALVTVLVIAVAGGLPGAADREIASAPLAAYAAGPPGATGRVSVLDTGDQRRLDVSTTMPPAPGGYYEVWLLDERTGRMVAIGALGETGRGSFTVPSGLDMAGYSVVDVSAERYDGDPSHALSVLRGTLTS